MDVFVPYGGLHALALAVCALLIAAPTLLARALRRDAEVVLRRMLAALAVCYWLAYNTWWNWHGLDLRTGLPLHICDVNGLIAPLALLTGWRWARATLYFWTSALTLQAFVQPALTAGPASLVFWAFWTAHTIIAACAVYDLAVLGFRPGWNDLGYALIVRQRDAVFCCAFDRFSESSPRRHRVGRRHAGGRRRRYANQQHLRLGEHNWVGVFMAISIFGMIAPYAKRGA